MQAEIWKRINGFEDYEVSNLGRIRREGHVLAPGKTTNGYPQVQLCHGGTLKNKLVHRLVAETFISNLLNLPEVNHKDEDKTNNAVDNLEWCTHKYNSNYGTCRARSAQACSKPVLQLDKDGNVLKEWPSATAAAKSLGMSRCNISSVCCGQLKQAGGFRWRFK